jgi:hypothetical protein
MFSGLGPVASSDDSELTSETTITDRDHKTGRSERHCRISWFELLIKER